jgi:4a-hydroxytetrahydrobiopterin dehydratase
MTAAGGGAGDELRTLAALHCVPGAPRLSDADLAAHLRALAGWSASRGAIEKTFRFSGYPATIAFVNAVADIAQREDHHPDLSVHYDNCVVSFSTHSAGGVTLNDIVCAARVEGALA